MQTMIMIISWSIIGNGVDTETYYKKNEELYGKIYRFKDLIAKEGILGTFKGTPVYADRDSRTIKEVIDDYRNQLLNLCCASVGKKADNIYFDEWTFKEEKKMPTKFTFYFNVNEGTRVDKSCNGTIPTMTTNIELLGGNVSDKVISIEGSATCDKADYDMRQGVLEALANAVFDGNFEKAYNKAAKANALCERQDRTCYYCGKVFDTVEEKQEHEAWHVERKKARRERYLLRKRAKEIAFEEQAQKMAKEMIKEDK